MKTKSRICIYSLRAMGILLMVLSISCKNTVKDIEGNRYKTVTIGTQVWMAENLRTTKFNDGLPIPLAADSTAWQATGRRMRLTDDTAAVQAYIVDPGGYCWYNNDAANKKKYGALYKWTTIKTNRLCPKGWHVPTVEEWRYLIYNYGGEYNAGDKLKEIGNKHWKDRNKGTNESGFTALPGGSRDVFGTFFGLGGFGSWWSSTEETVYREHTNIPSFFKISNFEIFDEKIIDWMRTYTLFLNDYMSNADITPINIGNYDGYSVRCLKDN
jgi:uncharacterized protein (TIGR02145 family)